MPLVIEVLVGAGGIVAYRLVVGNGEVFWKDVLTNTIVAIAATSLWEML